ncbi:MAG TPA: phage portal protein, partial [Rhodocyclaceae bacterium]|nr:phage portal protein [Rhodocyclaceae bacterium]
MGLLSRITAAFGAAETKASAGVPSQGAIPPLGSTPSAAGVLISQATAMSISAVYAAVKIRAQDVSRCTPHLVREVGDGSTEFVTDHPVAKLFKRPNRIQTWFEFCEQMEGALVLRSNAYAAILRNSHGDPIELIPINPDAVMVLEAVDGSIFYNVNRLGLFQIAVLQDFPVAIPAED